MVQEGKKFAQLCNN